MSKQKKNIAIIAGGDSGESVISLNGAEVVINNIDNVLYDAYIILIDGKEWNYIKSSEEKYKINKNDFSVTINNNKIIFDSVFNLIHGTPGENGKLQGYFDLLEIPYTSCDLFTSAITFNKYFCNVIVNSFGAKIAKSVLVRRNEKYDPINIANELSLPLFVKPNCGGSSLGIFKVDKIEDVKPSIEKAFEVDDEVIIEEFIEGTEITCGVMKIGGEKTVFPVTEIVSKTEFFDYDAKYTSGLAEEITPARISNEFFLKCQDTSSILYDKLNCKGVVRFDYILTKSSLYFLEVNTVPGLSERSIIPQQAEALGISLKELFTTLINESLS